MQDQKHSFSKSILCRRECDNCQKSIRFLGFKCRDCRYKCHKKCSSVVLTECELRDHKTNNGKKRSRKIWRKNFRNNRKWVLHKRITKDCNLWNESLSRHTHGNQQQKKRTGRRFMTGLCESFCHNANHTIDLQPFESEGDKPMICSEVTQTLDPCGFDAVGEDLADPQPILYLSSSPYQPYGNSFHTCSSGFYARTYSWSSRISARTTANSSGYCSGNNSCPSSANSHRSTSPTPDFSNIKLLSVTLEKCALDKESVLEESDISSSETEGEFLCTWPPFVSETIKETDDPAERDIAEESDRNTVINVYESNQRRHNCLVELHHTKDLWSVVGNISKEIDFDIKKSLREWNIPYSDLQFGEIVGVSPKGFVYRGRWHGEIMIHTRHKSRKEDLEEFLKEVSLLSMIRHENVVLFMGACLEPPNLAVVTSARKGLPLHTHLHVRQDLFALQSRINIAKQIAQGLGYLHAKGIVLSRLNSMNICLESKVKLCVTEYSSCCSLVEREGYASLPQGHLTYLAPELMRTLKKNGTELAPDSNHTVKSNVYAYGTILYEVLTGKWPFALRPADSVIWMIGKGRRQCVRHLKCPEELKDLIMNCWRENNGERPLFSYIVQILQEQNVPPEGNYRRHSFSEPEKINLVGRKHLKRTLR